VHGACGMRVTCVDTNGDAETRSYPTWFGGDSFQGGYERTKALDLLGNAERTREEAASLLTAPLCPSGEMDLILESSQVGLQVHESCGHPTELDRVFGTEITLAGGSFLDPKKLGSFRYGSEAVVDRGVFVDYLSSRETASEIGRTSTGTMRASGWDRIPLIRMTNVSLAPGNAGTLDDLVSDTKRGILMVTDRSWSIDDQRLDFHFSCELAWEIEHGKRTRLLKRPLYAGTTPKFWGACDAVCDEREWRLWGVASCGKGDPIQTIGVGHGASPARFRNVRIGSAS
jgi:TldD protein